MPVRAKRVSLVALWLTIGISATVVVITAGWSAISTTTVVVLLVVAVLVTRYILTRATIPEERATVPGERGP